MNRSIYFNLCEEKLSVLCTRIELRGSLNVLDIHVHAENFYRDLFNILFDWNLENINQTMQNADGIDLIDRANKLIIQVSSTVTKAKIDKSLSKNLSYYKGWNFKFISISKEADHLKGKVFKNPHGLIFASDKDIYDIKFILSEIQHFNINKQREVFNFLKNELEPISDPISNKTNIADVINILAKEDFEVFSYSINSRPFLIEKKLVFNNLKSAIAIVNEYKIQHHRIDGVYQTFNLSGKNKSNSILNWIRSSYIKESINFSNDQLFFQVVDVAIRRVQSSSNYVLIPLEELEMCVNAIIVDAFIRCKIFEHPDGESNVIA